MKYKSKYLNLQKQIGGENHTWVGEWTLDKDKKTHGVWKGNVDSNPMPNFTGNIIPDKGNILLIGSVYKHNPNYGNFLKMVKNDIYKDVLFIYNENSSQFLGKSGEPNGSGNGPMRGYNTKANKNKPRSAAIVTCYGFNGSTITDEHIIIIDDSVKLIKKVIKDNNYKYIMYSSDISGDLGFAAAAVDTTQAYKDYLNKKIKSLSVHRPIVCDKLLSTDNKIMKKIEEYAIKIGVGIEPKYTLNIPDTSYAR